MTTLGRAETPQLTSTRRLTAALYLYAGWYALCALVALGRAAHLRGEPYIPSRGDSYTDSIDIWPGALAPLRTLLLYTAWLGHLVAAALVVWAVVRLADPRVRAAHGTWSRLLVGTLLVAGIVVLAISAPGETVRNWILD